MLPLRRQGFRPRRSGRTPHAMGDRQDAHHPRRSIAEMLDTKGPSRQKAKAKAQSSTDPDPGAVAQLVERLVRNEEVRGSNPLGSTRLKSLRV